MKRFKLNEEQIDEIERITDNRFNFIEYGNKLEEVEEEYGDNSESGVYIFLGDYEEVLIISFFNDVPTIQLKESTGEYDKQLKIEWLIPIVDVIHKRY